MSKRERQRALGRPVILNTVLPPNRIVSSFLEQGDQLRGRLESVAKLCKTSERLEKRNDGWDIHRDG